MRVRAYLAIGVTVAGACTLDFGRFEGDSTSEDCEAECTDVCMACTEELTGEPDGVCAPVLPTTDPDMECAPEVCDGEGACVDLCGLLPTPAGECPPECTGGCDGGTCLIQCDGTRSCENATITCPPDYACSVSCDGVSACESATLICPETAPCSLSCGGDNNVCQDLEMTCGQNQCEAICAPSFDDPTVDCGDSCSCEIGSCN